MNSHNIRGDHQITEGEHPQQIAAIIEFLPDATFVINLDHKVIAWNRAMEELTGVPKAEIINRGDYAYALPFYRKPRPLLIDFILESELLDSYIDKYYSFKREGCTFCAEGFMAFAYSGKGAFLWAKASPLYDSGGNITGSIESFRDISLRKRMEDELKGHREMLEELVKSRTKELVMANEQLKAEIAGREVVEKELHENLHFLQLLIEELRLSREQFSRVFRASPCAMSVHALADGRIIDVNDTFLRCLGYRRDEVVGLTPLELGLWGDQAERQKMRDLLLQQGSIRNLETNFQNKSGDTIIGLLSAEIIELKGEPCILIAVIDITEHKRFEQEMNRLERLNLVGQMAAGIGHEIRNPMTTVRGFLQLLGDKEGCRAYGQFFSLMIDELDRANSIITEFLALAKNKPIDLSLQNINTTISSLYPLINADAVVQDKQVELELAAVPELHLDEKEIRQVILNLVRNGLEAMPIGRTLSIRTYVEHNEVVMAIQDQGSGIKPDLLEKLGTPFFTTKEDGTGLGLAVCYSIVARHGASIKIVTGPGGSTVFVRFKLPEDPVPVT